MSSCRRMKGIAAASILALMALAMWAETVAADEVDDVLATHLSWRQAHPVAKARLRVIGGATAPTGSYYLDLQNPQVATVAIMSVPIGKAEFVVRTVNEAGIGRMFFNEDVYVEFNLSELSLQGGTAFWEAQDVPAVRTWLGTLFQIKGVSSTTVDGVTYQGIEMELEQDKWEACRAMVRPLLTTDLPQGFWPYVTMYFGPSGELHSLLLKGADIDIAILYYDWTDLVGDRLAEMQDARRLPHADQEKWDEPVDGATLRYLVQLTE